MSDPKQFTHRIIIEPLGLLYGSKGRFLSPENLVGRSGIHFPPDTPTLSGLFAHCYEGDRAILDPLILAGPFWAKRGSPTSFYVPTPFHCWVEGGEVIRMKNWTENEWQWQPVLDNPGDYKKREFGTWISIDDWAKVRSPQALEKAKAKAPIKAHTGPWQEVPHLHPRLRPDERRSVGKDEDQGSLFLEYGIQLDPEMCLVYLSNVDLPQDEGRSRGCYRFGGEGHLVQVRTEILQPDEPIQTLLNSSLGQSFATICPGVWGSNRLSYRGPLRDQETNEVSWPDNPVEALLTQRPNAFRYRLGNQTDGDGNSVHKANQAKRLSRGRYAVPAGSVYVLEKPLKRWLEWENGTRSEGGWFPTEGYSFQRWGSALALPLEIST